MLSFHDIARGSLLEENHYYPHGLPIKALTSTAQGVKDNRRKYQSNEYIKDLGLNWMDFNARQYDAQIGRFLAVDPLAERHCDITTYVSMGNDPILFKDPDGNDWWATVVFGMKHPLIATEIGSVSNGSTNISTNAARFSTRGASPEAQNPVLNMNNAREGDEVNAFRHTLWQAAITSKFGEEIANEVGRAHEENPAAIDGMTTDRLQRATFRTLAEADQSIDLANNVIGRQIGNANEKSNMKTLAQEVLGKFATDGLWTAQQQDDGSFRIVNTKITREQFKALQQVFQNLNNFGYTFQEQNIINNNAQREQGHVIK